MSSKTDMVGLILLCIICYNCAEGAAKFTEELRLNHLVSPAKMNDQSLYTYYENDTTVITSPKAGYEECKILGIIPPNHRRTLGNGKMVAFTMIYTHFTIVDFNNCSSNSVKQIDDGTPYHYKEEKVIHGVIPYHDTFDIFGQHSNVCNPCRYNDRGERVQVDSTLTPEAENHDEDFIDSVKNIPNVGDGYIYAFSLKKNDSTTLRILDSNYKVVKERTLAGKFSAFSSTHGRITVCTHINTCPKSLFECYTLKCQLLDLNLKTIADANVNQPKKNPSDMSVRCRNLPNGGAMITMEYDFWDILSGEKKQRVFIQQINADGTVEKVISFGTFAADYLSIHDFIKNNGDYCLVAGIDLKKDKDNYTLIKCVTPKTTKKD